MEFNEFFVQGMALLGAGIAMVAGFGQGIGEGTRRCGQRLHLLINQKGGLK